MSASARSDEEVLPHLDRRRETSKMSILPSRFCSELSVAEEDQRSPLLVMAILVEYDLVVLSVLLSI